MSEVLTSKSFDRVVSIMKYLEENAYEKGREDEGKITGGSGGT